MPAIADLAGIAFAYMAYGLLLIAAAILGWLAGAIPNPSILGFHPLGFIQTLLQDIEHFFDGLADGVGVVLHDLIMSLTWSFSQLFGLITGIFSNHAAALDHIAGTTVPQAITTANGHANTAVAGERARATHAEQQLAQAAAQAGSAAAAVKALVGIVGHGTVESDIAQARGEAVSSAKSYTDQQAHDLVAEMQSKLAGVWSAIKPLQTAVSTTIPAEIRQAADQAAATASSDAAAVQAQLTARVVALQDQLDSTRSDLQDAISSASAAQAAVSASDLTTAEGQAQAAAGVAQAAAAAQAAAGLATAVGALQKEIDAANGAIAAGSATTTIRLPALPDVSIPGTIAVPIAVGALAQAVAGVLEEVDSCMVSNCGSGPNNIGNVLKTLLGAGLDLAEFGFIAAAIKDPTGTADALAPLLGTIDQGATDLWRAILEVV